MDVVDFIHETNWKGLPQDVRRQARRCLLDTLGAGISASRTKLSKIIHGFAASVFGGQGGYLWLDGREVSPPGAALANGMTIDSLDIHDGHPLAKGHAGAAIVPATLATIPFRLYCSFLIVSSCSRTINSAHAFPPKELPASSSRPKTVNAMTPVR